jgi:mRNA interferase MazF
VEVDDSGWTSDGTAIVIRRGEVYAVDLEPVRGSESNKLRPVVVVSNDTANATAARLGRGVIAIVPLTSNVHRLYPFQTLLPALATGLPQDSKAQAEQVRSIAVERVGSRLGEVPDELMHQVDEALRLHLAL